MTKTTKTQLAISLLTVLTFLLALPALAADATLAEMSVDAASVSFHATSGGAMTLTISGPEGFSYRNEVQGGESPVFEIFDASGNLLADGLYNYELVARGAVPQAQRDELRGLGAQVKGVRQSGTFRVSGGAVVDPTLAETPTEKAGAITQKVMFHTGDGSIDGSLCVGFDCVASESFGFDTFRVKENNLRIHFDDTSASASFPGNDWRLVANDSSNGGANHFSIEDATAGRTPFKVEAGAPSNTLYVESDGDVGIGTSNPAVRLHVVKGDSPALRLEQDGSSGFTPQTWDLAGNETNFFVRDVTNGSKLPFRIQPGSGNDNALYIASDGDIGFGTTSPAADLHIEDTSGHADFQLETSSQGWKWRANSVNGTMTVIDDTNNKTPLVIASGTDNNLLQLGVNAAGRVDITGSLYINGIDNSTPDYVFEPDYELESIDEHTAYMWTNKHLPAVHAAQVDDGGKTFFELGARSQGTLEELEKAHLYIAQLHEAMKAMGSRLEALEADD